MHPHGIHNDDGAGAAGAQDPVDYWQARYGDAGQIWSGRPNKALVDVVSGVAPGRALDLGCGEGGDAIWLAGQGWEVTGVDIASNAINRASEAAVRRGIPRDRIEWIAHDLSIWNGDGTYDLVTASFLHSTVELPREVILGKGAGLVAPGGHLLIVSHADFPPWSDARAHHHDHEFLSPEQEIATLGLPESDWDVEIAETRERAATGPNGEQAVLQDGVVFLRRR